MNLLHPSSVVMRNVAKRFIQSGAANLNEVTLAKSKPYGLCFGRLFSVLDDSNRNKGPASDTGLAPAKPLHLGSRTQETVDRRTVSGPHGDYLTEYEASLSNPEEFWSRAAAKLHWYSPPRNIFSRSESNPYLYSWFSDGVINTCYNCLDLHVKNGRANQDAIIYDSPLTGVKERITYSELLDQVSRFAGALTNQFGVQAGDRVVIYMPMIPQAIVAMLACTRIGAVHCVVFGGFASQELATRIADSEPKIVISASAGIEPGGRVVPYKPLLDRALELCSHTVDRCIIVQREVVQVCTLGKNDYSYDEVMANAKPIDAVPLPSTHPHYILYTSGTTGLPKGVLRDTGSYATALKWSMSAFYNTNPGEVMFTASDIGWVVGHSYIVYAPLLQGCTTVLYEGKPVNTPDASAYWRVIEEYGVTTMFTAPTAFRAIKQADPEGKLVHGYDLSSFRTLFLAGERSDPDTLHWCENAMKEYNVPTIDHWWQTELGFPGVGNSVGLGKIPTRYGACAAPVPGFDVCIFDENGEPAPRGTLGDMAIKLPLPPGALPTLHRNNDRYVRDYLTKYPGYYNTGDAAVLDDDGYIHVLARTDDIINTAGHRLSTGRMEEILMDHPEVAECAVIGVSNAVKGQVPVGFVVTINGSTIDEATLRQELVEMVRNQIGPIASFKQVAVVKGLPKTRSGKILRKTMANIANGEKYTITPTIEDASVFNVLRPVIEKLVREQ